MNGLYDFELGKASDILCRELLQLRPGETVVITADTKSDPRVVDATARAAFACDAKPLVATIATPLGLGKAADAMIPLEPLTALLQAADAWVEFNYGWLLYSTPYDRALAANPKLRHLCLVGMHTDMMVRCIGRIDFPALEAFLTRIAEMTAAANHIRMTTPSGGNVEFANSHARGPDIEVRANTPGSHFLAGQIAWPIDIDSVNGTIVFDGSLVPPCGVLQEPVVAHVKHGVIEGVEGGAQARQWDAWTRAFGHPQMRRLAHICYGFNPGAILSGDILEDERVWGSTDWGVGQSREAPAPSHTDGICLNTSVWLDGVQIMEEGRLVVPELVALASKLGK
jgi:2,5-dihydroxypyridine 5,6-dioxygenase